MKARLLHDVIVETTGQVWAKGTEVDIIEEMSGTFIKPVRVVFPDETQKVLTTEFVEVLRTIDWEQIKINAAVSIAQGFAANGSFSASGEDYIAGKSVRVADKLVEKLRGGM